MLGTLHIERRSIMQTLTFVGAVALSVTMGHAEVVRDPLKTYAIFDLGQFEGGTALVDQKGQIVQRTAVSVTEAVNIEDRLRIVVGIGGLFYYTSPETIDWYRRVIKFGPGIEQANATLKIGDKETPWSTLQFGLIPFKYNPDAKNLGEYLFRSTAYPNILVTGGWSIVNSALMPIQGAIFETRTGPVKHDLVLSVERDLEPTGDLTPAYLVSYQPHPAFEIGAGVALAHLISFKSKKTTPDGPANPGSDPTLQPLNRYKNDTLVTDPNDSGYSNYTFKATKLVGRVAFNPQAILQSDWLNPEDLKVYGEIALLGVKNYPYYYEDRTRRMPIMVGFNIPTFKALDMLSVEFEYRRPEFQNDRFWSFEKSAIPVPNIERANSTDTYGQTVANYDKDKFLKQGVKWSVYAARDIIPGITLYAQVASDHYRGIDPLTGAPMSQPTIRTPSDWYYLFRLQMGI